MMLYLTIVLLATVLVAHCQYTRNSCWHQGRWVSPGTRYDRGRYYYECRGGREEPKGCITNSNQRVDMGQTFTFDKYEYRCQMDNNNQISIQVTGCIDRSSRFTADQTWATSDNKCWRQCTRQLYDSLRADLMGCVTPQGRKIKTGDIYNEGDSALQCRQSPANSNSECKIECHSCVHKGQRYDIGQSWPDGEFVYYCSYNKDQCEKVCVGCMFEGEELESGDRYFRDQSVYQCDISSMKNEHKLVGCTYTDKYRSVIQKIVGCKWVNEEGYGIYEVECVNDEGVGRKAYRGCVYQKNGVNYLSVEPGHYTVWWDGDTKTAVGCTDQGLKRAPRMESWTPNGAYDTRGLKYSVPRGAYSKRRR